MNLRPKTKRRLAVLLTAIAGVTVIATAGVVIGLRRHENRRLQYRALAIDAFKHGKYQLAAETFPKYLGNDRIDAEAIFDYGLTRSKLAREDISNLTEAKALFIRYLELKPGDVEARHQLLAIYQALRYTSESTALYESLLQQNPEDVSALTAKFGELLRTMRFDQALSVSMRLNELAPTDLRMQQKTYELMARLRRPALELNARADSMLMRHPQDPRFELLRAVAAYQTGNQQETRQWLETAASRTPPDADFLLLLVGAFDRLGLWPEARNILEIHAASCAASSGLKRELAQQLWELNQPDKALEVLKDTSLADAGADSNLLGLKVFIEIGKASQSEAETSAATKQALITLRSRSNDLPASGWIHLIEGMRPDHGVIQEMRSANAATQADPTNSIFRYYLGRAYLRVGEGELALRSLSQTTQMQPEWAAPHVVIASILLQRGQLPAALREARLALERDPQQFSAQLIAAVLQYKLLTPAATQGEIKSLIEAINQLREIAPNDAQLLCAQIDLLARSGKQHDAVDLATASLSQTTVSTPAGLRQLAEANELDRLNITALIAKHLDECETVSPQETMDQILAYVRLKQTDSARRVLKSIESRPTTGWRLTLLQGRDVLGDNQISTGWASLADAQPADLEVQQAVMRSVVCRRDRALIDRTIDRLKSLTGDNAIEWKIARARWQAEEVDNGNSLANAAAASMADVVRIAPNYSVPQVVWAEALIKAGNSNDAIAHLQAATRIDSSDLDLKLRLASLHLELHQTRELRQVAGIVEADEAATCQQRMRLAGIYRQIGDRAAAIRCLQNSRCAHRDLVERDLLLARFFAEDGDDLRAREIYDRWLLQKDKPLRMVAAAAQFWALRGNIDKARQVLSGFSTDQPDVSLTLARATFEASWGDADLAKGYFQSAATAAPKELGVWLSWAGSRLRAGDYADTFAVCDLALEHLPADPKLLQLKARSQTLAGLNLDLEIDPLLASIAEDPADAAAAATLDALATSETTRDRAARLAIISAKFPKFWPASNLLIFCRLKLGEIDAARELANHGREQFPIDPGPAQMLGTIELSSHSWAAAVAACNEWRSRSLDNPHPADLSIASAYLGLGQPDQAANQVSWYRTLATPADMNSIDRPPLQARAVEIFARALCMQSRPGDAWTLVQQLSESSPVWTDRWLRIVGDCAMSPRAGEEMIERVHSPGSLPEAEARFVLACRFDDRPMLERVGFILKQGRPGPVSIRALQLAGCADQEIGDLTGARRQFSLAQSASASSAAVKNNLAMTMLLQDDDLQRAKSLAVSASAAEPDRSEIHSTLAQVLQRVGDGAQSEKEFECALHLNAENMEALIGDVQIAIRKDAVDQVQLKLKELDSLEKGRMIAIPNHVRAQLKVLRQAINPGLVGPR